MTTAPKQDPATRTPWQRLTTAERREQVRQAVQVNGMTYTQAAVALGATSREAIAGVVERAKRSPDPIVSTSGLHYGGNYRAKARWPKGAAGGNAYASKVKANKGRAAARQAKPKPAKKPHAGFQNYVPLSPSLPPAEPAIIRADAWLPLPGSSPVPLERHKDGCRWPVNEDRPYLSCNETTKPDSPYCPRHSALAFRDLPTRRDIRKDIK